MRPLLLIVCVACSGGPDGLGPGGAAPPGTQIGQEGDLPACERVELPVDDLDVPAEGLAYSAADVWALATQSASGRWVSGEPQGAVQLELASHGARVWRSQVPDSVVNPPDGYCGASGYVLDSDVIFESDTFVFEGEVAVFSHQADAFSFRALMLPVVANVEPPENPPDLELELQAQFHQNSWQGSVLWMDTRFEPAIFVESAGEWIADPD